MTINRLYKYLVALFIFGIILSGYLVHYASGWLENSSQDLAKLRTDVYVLTEKSKYLDTEKRYLDSHSPEINTLDSVLPKDKDQAKVIKQLESIADKSGIKFDSISFPTSSLGSSTQIAKPTTTDSATTNNTNISEAPPKPSKVISQATPLKDIPGVQTIEITLGALSSKDSKPGAGMRYPEMISFIKQLERNQRIIQTQSIQIGQAPSNNKGEPMYILTVSITVFLRS